MPIEEDDLRLFAARLALGRITGYEVYELADKLTNAGEGSQDLVDIIVEGNDGRKEFLLQMATKYLESRGIPLPSEDDARIEEGCDYAKRILSGEFSPSYGAYQLWRAWLGDFDPSLANSKYNFNDFVHLSDYCDSIVAPEERRRVEQEILELARRLINDRSRGDMTHWLRESI